MQNVPKIVRDRLQAARPAVDHPDADLLTAFAEQSLRESERVTVLDHLSRCADCRDIVALALPPTETSEVAARPVRSAWLTWPALRWGLVAAGVVVVASIGVLQVQRHSAASNVAVRSTPSVQVASNEARPQLTAAVPTAPAAKQDEAKPTERTDFHSVDGVAQPNGVAREEKTTAPAPPPPPAGMKPFHGYVGGTFGGVVGGPKPPSQFQNNYNVQQKASNAASTPAVSQSADLNSTRQAPAASETAAVAGGAATGTTDTESAHLEAQLRDEPSDSRLFADRISVSKTKLPETNLAPGQIAGQVVDSSGAVVANARITVTPATAGKSATAMTDSRGQFLIAGLPTGNYKAQAQAPGFNTTVQDLKYDSGRPLSYNFTLNVGSVAETVEVSSAQSLVRTEPSPVGGPVTNSKGRNYTEMASISPGVSGQQARWTVGASGALQRSFDQGTTWQTVNVNPSPASAASMHFAKERGKDASKEEESDKKLVKQEITSPVFRAVTASGAEVWAGGSAGALYHSFDAGNHWTRVTPSSGGTALTGDILSLEFTDSQNGEVRTSTSEVWTTRDSGQTWQKQ